MSVALLDVNILIALFDPAHPQYEDAHYWFGRNRRKGWATCSITINGCVRIISNPAYPSIEASAGEVIQRLRTFCESGNHHSWSDDASLLDGARFRSELIGGHRQVTDIHLLGLAVRRGGRLATFDRTISPKVVVGATADSIEYVGQAPDSRR